MYEYEKSYKSIVHRTHVRGYIVHICVHVDYISYMNHPNILRSRATYEYYYVMYKTS